MKLLLDTHIWIWSVGDPQRLNRRVAKALGDVQNQLWLSPVSIWEALLLHRKGRLRVPEGFFNLGDARPDYDATHRGPSEF